MPNEKDKNKEKERSESMRFYFACWKGFEERYMHTVIKFLAGFFF